MKKYLVAIFYIESEGQGNEIALAIEGWKRHFKNKHEILVVGDKPPVDGVNWMYVERVPEREGQYRPALDICNKLMYVCQYCHENMYNGFIWASDDFFAVNDFSIRDVKTPKYFAEQLPSKGGPNQNEFWNTQVKTRKLCEREGIGVVNWTTHLPMLFDEEKLYWLIHDYNMTESGYIVENVYYNKYPPKVTQHKLTEFDRWKYEVSFTPLDKKGLENALLRKIWVCCSVNGWCPELEEVLREHYGIQLNRK